MNLSYIDTRYAAFFRFVRAVIVCLFLFSCPVSAGISLHMANNIDLSNNAILDMYQDENGYMWIGTYDGLNLYNGKNTYVFRFEPNNKNTLCSNIINKIVYGGDGFLWVSTSMGLNRFSLKDRKVTESYTEYPECLNVVSDSAGNTLLIKQKDFISCYSPETGSFQDVHVQGMNEEVSKVLFANGERQFFILDADGCLLEICPDFESFPLVLDIKKTPIHEKEIDRAYYLDGTLYYVDMENHFYSYRMKDRRKEYLADLTGWMEQYGKLSRIALFHSVPYLVFRNGLLLNIDNQEEALRFDVGLFCVLPDRKQDILWVGTDGQGVRMYYDKYNRFSGIQLKSLPIVVRNPVRSIYTEDEKTIWFGTKGNGFVRVEDYDSYEKGKLPYGNYVLKVRYKNDVFDSDAKEYFLHIRVLPPWYRGSWAMIAYGLVLATICLGIVYWLRRRIVEKQAEVARKIREEQKEKLYEAKLNFFANITHELCTPLTLINGVNDYIKISADRLADGKLEKYARILGENVTNLNELIQEILDIRKIEEVGFSHIQIKRVSVSSLIRKQCESFIPVAEQNGINFTFSDVDKPVYWNTDVPSLKKIIRNLVSNAFKYTEQKGTIDVSVRIENESLIIKVYNTGKGIAEADLKTIFDRFHILGDLDGNNYTQMTSRNGLGLFICHSMVQLLRGEINVESKEGESAGFIVTLPYLEVEEMDLDEQADEEVPVAQPVAAEATAETTGNIGNPVILVVDDNRDIVWLIKETLSSEYAVREAFNAEEALALMDQQTPDLIITDIMMPSMDGFALISRIKSDKFTRHIPLIVVSAKVSESEQAEGLDLGADVYLTKPFSSVVLHSVVNRLMANKKELKDYYYSPESAYEQSGGQLIHQEDKEFMDSVTAIIKENLAQDTLRPELIADKLGMNTRALYRRFKKISLLTPSDFIKDYRMMHAARLLVTTNLSVQEIIYQVGISNKSYFYREFSAKYGVTPGEYRRMQ